MTQTPPAPRGPLTPLAIVKPPKRIGDMTAAERKAFADEIFDKMNAARKPA